MIVNMNTPAKTVAEFIALAKSQPGKISFGSGSSSSRVAGEMFQQMAGVELLHVPYKSNPLAINDLLGGQINMMITDMATGLPQVKGGKVRALAVSTSKRSPLDARPADHRRGRRQGLRHGLLVRGLRAREHAARRREQAARRARRGDQGRGDADSSTPRPAPIRSRPRPPSSASSRSAESEKWKNIIKKAGIEPE